MEVEQSLNAGGPMPGIWHLVGTNANGVRWSVAFTLLRASGGYVGEFVWREHGEAVGVEPFTALYDDATKRIVLSGRTVDGTIATVMCGATVSTDGLRMTGGEWRASREAGGVWSALVMFHDVPVEPTMRVRVERFEDWGIEDEAGYYSHYYSGVVYWFTVSGFLLMFRRYDDTWAEASFLGKARLPEGKTQRTPQFPSDDEAFRAVVAYLWKIERVEQIAIYMSGRYVPVDIGRLLGDS